MVYVQSNILQNIFFSVIYSQNFFIIIYKMTLSSAARLLSLRVMLIQPVRFGHKIRGKGPGVAKSLQQRLQELQAEDPLYAARTDIGLPFEGKSRSEFVTERLAHLKTLKSDKELEKLSRKEKLFVDTDQVRADWQETLGPIQKKKIADHYGVFRDLYGEGYFTPRITLDVFYELGDDRAMPVYYGNVIKPEEAKCSPAVSYTTKDDTLWTLVMSGLDSHLQEAEKEYVHWFIANIPGNKLEQGDLLVEYMRPIPPRGTGYHRFVFVLYKQNSRVQYDIEKVDSNSVLDSRTFVTREWYKRYQDYITPAGLAFYQSDWDQSLTHYYHHALNMKEPVFEYDFPEPYNSPQKWFPLKQPFNLYMDRYRDPKQINKEYFLRKLKNEHPLQDPEPPLRFPNAHAFPKNMPSWLKNHERKIRLKWGRINDV